MVFSSFPIIGFSLLDQRKAVGAELMPAGFGAEQFETCDSWPRPLVARFQGQ